MEDKNNNKDTQSQGDEKKSSMTVSYKDNEFEMMSIPEGGADNKSALESLKRASK
jgi:hypothetical protein